MDKKTDTWEIFEHPHETTYYKEERPNVFVLRGYLEGVTMARESFKIDGKIYTCGEEFEVGKVRMNLDSIDYANKRFTEEQYFFHSISEYVAELPPFGAARVMSPKYRWGADYEPDFDSPFYDMGGEKLIFNWYSQNYTANLIMRLAKRMGRKAYTAKEGDEEDGSELIFHYCVYKYGFNNGVYVKMRFDDILNMDCTLFSDECIEELKSYCRSICIINDCLDFNVFSRPLTNEEKLQSAALFIDWYNRYKQYQHPYGRYPRINELRASVKQYHNINFLPKRWKQQTLGELTELQ